MGRKPTPPTIIMPSESNPQAFQTIIPQKSYKNLAERMGRMDTEYNRLLKNRYDSVGTAAEMGARARGSEMMEDAAYLSSIPDDTGTTDFLTTPTAFPIKSNNRGTFDTVPGSVSGFGDVRPGTGGNSKTSGTAAVKEAAKLKYEASKLAYKDALERAKNTPRSFVPVTKKGFDAKQYLANYKDLQDDFGDDENAARKHYVEFGKAEGRTDDEDTSGLSKGVPGYARNKDSMFLPKKIGSVSKQDIDETQSKQIKDLIDSDVDEIQSKQIEDLYNKYQPKTAYSYMNKAN